MYKFLSSPLRLAALLILVWTTIGFAAAPRFEEDDLAPPSVVTRDPPETAPEEAPPVRDTAEPPTRVAPAMRSPAASLATPALGRRAAAQPAAEAPNADAAPLDEGELSYTVRPGETLSEIAATFHLNSNELARANHLGLGDPLLVGTVLRIPSPFSAQVKQLETEVKQLNDQAAQARQKLEAATAETRNLHAQVDELAAAGNQSRHDARMLPWWKTAATTAGIVVLLLIGVTAVAAADWFSLRRRFRTVAEMNEALRRLDHKYKAVLAKAELRFQQLYGRRRLGMNENQSPGKISEEYEMERLDQELRLTLAEHLERLGLRRRRGGLRARQAADEITPAQVRTGRQ